jgi:hypothetical protein
LSSPQPHLKTRSDREMQVPANKLVEQEQMLENEFNLGLTHVPTPPDINSSPSLAVLLNSITCSSRSTSKRKKTQFSRKHSFKLASGTGEFPPILPQLLEDASAENAALWANSLWPRNLQKTTWENLRNRICHSMQECGVPVRKQSLKYLAKKVSGGAKLQDSSVITYEQYQACKLGEWLYFALRVIKKHPFVWEHNSLQAFLDHDDAIAILKHYRCQHGDFVFRISSDLNSSQGTELRLVCTYVERVDGKRVFRKKDLSGHEEDPEFVLDNNDLQRVLRLEVPSSSRPKFISKAKCIFNTAQNLRFSREPPHSGKQVDVEYRAY